MGEAFRLDSWRRVLHEIGARTSEIRLVDDHRVALRRNHWPDPLSVLRGSAVPESLMWSPSALAARIERERPDHVLFLTSRAFSHRVSSAPVTLDHVDHLGANYRRRAPFASPLSARGVALRALGPLHDRFDRWAKSHIEHRVAAGWADAEALDAAWFPMLAPPPRRITSDPTWDLLFFGNLTYEPNVAAVELLARMWPDIVRRRPGTTLCVAGRYPSERVRTAQRARGWHLEEDFADVAELCARAKVGVAPLPIATGMQTKVLEAAAFGLPQVISEPAALGFGPHVPAQVAVGDADFVEATLALLNDDDARRGAADDALDVLGAHYSEAAWVDATRRLLGLE